MLENKKIDELTVEDKAKILFFIEKWEPFVLSTQRINEQKLTDATKLLYSYLEQREPKIIFCPSPKSALENIPTGETNLRRRIEKRIRRPLRQEIESQISFELMEELLNEFASLTSDLVCIDGQLEYCIKMQLNFRKFISTDYWLCLARLSDFVISVLSFNCDPNKLEIIYSMAKYCYFMFPYSETCIICDRPIIISYSSFEDGEYLHSEIAPTVQFSDGFHLNILHGDLVEK